MKRTATREQAFKLLYSLEIQKDYEQKQIDIYIEQNEIIDENARNYIRNTIHGIINQQKEIQKTISMYLKEDWSIERISKVNLAILEIAIYEIKQGETPYKVVINEAVELAKKYGDTASQAFINGILASVVQEKQN